MNGAFMAFLFNVSRNMLQTLGALKLEYETNIRVGKPLLIFAYMLIEKTENAGNKHTRKKLERIFFDNLPSQAKKANSLSGALSKLKKANLIDYDQESAWALDGHTSDVELFRRLIDENNLHRASYEIYQGKFLNGVFVRGLTSEAENWIFEKREEIEGIVFNAKVTLAKQELEKIDLDKAVKQGESAWFRHAEALSGSTIDPQVIKDLYILLGVGSSKLKEDLERRIEEDFPDLDISFDELKGDIDELRQKTTLKDVNTTLPQALTRLIGRDKDLEQVHQLTKRNRLVTLLGLGGVGKTRLAMQFAELSKTTKQFSDGVYYYSLETVTPQQFIYIIAQGLEIAPSYNTELAIKQHLEDKSLLLVLDNFEHLVGEKETLAALLTSSPKSKIIITSRERSNLDGEQLYDVQGLNYPKGIPNEIAVEEAQTYPAVQLFVNRRTKIQTDFVLNQESTSNIIHICQTIWGMPLAIELAAGMRHRTLADIAEGIGTLDFLKSRIYGKPERHQTLRHTFEYSWHFLNSTEKQVFRQISVFQDGFTLEAARAIVDNFTGVEVDLLDKSLLTRNQVGRYRMHPLLHEYAFEKLREHSQDKSLVEDRHANYYLEQLGYVIKAPNPKKKVDAPKNLSSELSNIRQAWSHAIENSWSQRILNGTHALERLFDLTARYQEGISLLGKAESVYGENHQDSQDVLANLLASKAWLIMRLNQYKKSVGTAEQSLSLISDSNNYECQRTALNSIGVSLMRLGEFSKSKSSFERVAELASQHGRDTVSTSINLALAERCLGNYRRVKELLNIALAICETQGNHNLQLAITNIQSLTLIDEQKFESAEALLLNAIAEANTMKNSHMMLILPLRLAVIRKAQDRLEEAQNIASKSLYQAQIKCKRSLEAEVLTLIGSICVIQENYDSAKLHFTQSLSICRELNNIPLNLQVLISFCELDFLRNNAKAIRTWCSLDKSKDKMVCVDRRRFEALTSRYERYIQENQESYVPLSIDSLTQFLTDESLNNL